MAQAIKSVVIVGGGTAGWMAAAGLAKYAKGKELSVCLIDSSHIPTVGVGEATVPNIVEFNRNLGLDEQELIKATQATFKLGIQFENWLQQGHHFFHPFADFGFPIDHVDFHHYLYRAKKLEHDVQLSDYCFPCQLAKIGHFAQPHPNPPSPLADYSYAYHFDASLYAQFLQNFAKQHGVVHIDGRIEKVNKLPDTGFIHSVVLHDGRQIAAELFIDCSGFQGLLIEKALNTGYEDWSHWLLCDSAIALQTTRHGPVAPYTRSIAQKAGWQWSIPLQHRMGNGCIYSRQYQNDGEATDVLLQNVAGEPLTEPRILRFTPGRRKQIWHKNCFALGLAGGFLEPLESTSISLIQTAIAKLLSFFPDSDFNPADIAEVNRLHNQEMENIRDFLILHYKLSQRNDSEFWLHCQRMDIPDSLTHKIALWQSRGHIVQYDNESFQPASWLAIYDGFDCVPGRYDSRADQVNFQQLIEKLRQMRSSISNAARQSLSHQQFIERHCQADPV